MKSYNEQDLKDKIQDFVRILAKHNIDYKKYVLKDELFPDYEQLEKDNQPGFVIGMITVLVTLQVLIKDLQ
jgi:hypothetical protein